jgi:hypothetical protein
MLWPRKTRQSLNRGVSARARGSTIDGTVVLRGSRIRDSRPGSWTAVTSIHPGRNVCHSRKRDAPPPAGAKQISRTLASRLRPNRTSHGLLEPTISRGKERGRPRHRFGSSLWGLKPDHVVRMYSRHAAFGPKYPTGTQPRGNSCLRRQIEYWPSSFFTTAYSSQSMGHSPGYADSATIRFGSSAVKPRSRTVRGFSRRHRTGAVPWGLQKTSGLHIRGQRIGLEGRRHEIL